MHSDTWRNLVASSANYLNEEDLLNGIFSVEISQLLENGELNVSQRINLVQVIYALQTQKRTQGKC